MSHKKRGTPTAAKKTRSPTRLPETAGFAISRRFASHAVPGFWLIATLTAGALLAATWFKWMDIIIDCGRELYVPWRILQGEQLGRDIIHPYGPLSVYYHAALFKIFGVSIRALVASNLIIYALLTAATFHLLRRCFGFLPAAAATLFGIAVFGFGQHLYAAGYTFAFPYSHEATHGLTLFIGLLLVLTAPRNSSRFTTGLLAGALTGLLWLTKTEFVFASALVLVVDVVRRSSASRGSGAPLRWLAGLFAGFVVVFAIGWLALAREVGGVMALRTMTMAEFAPFYLSAYTKSSHVLRFLGVDQLGGNLASELIWGLGSLGFLLGASALGRAVAAASFMTRPVATALTAGIGGVVGVLAYRYVGWVNFGWALPALLLGAFYFFAKQIAGWRKTTRAWPDRTWAIVLSLVAGAAMLVRMAFAPKLYHYGFFQAYLATHWILAFLVSAQSAKYLPAPRARMAFATIVLAAFAGVAAASVQHSLWIYEKRSTPVGEGPDRVFGYRPEVYPFSNDWNEVRRYIDANTRPDSTLLVVPEGLSLNYWARRKQPLRIMDVLPATLRLNPGDVLADLKAAKPETVVFVTRDNMSELGYAAYGADVESGKLIVDWVVANYDVASQTGPDPFTPKQYGIRVFRRRP